MFAEGPLFFLVVCYLHLRVTVSSDPRMMAWLTAMVGALLALSGLWISLWSFYTAFRAGIIIGTGHYVENQHKLVTDGAYGLVRHPIYLGAFLIWFSLAISFNSLIVLLLTLFYLIPTLLLYIRSEENMMLSEFGDEYRRYCDRVGMVLPRLRHWS
jgi:protein-S-isoprenylcysteine O-methyltransferase Ste14